MKKGDVIYRINEGCIDICEVLELKSKEFSTETFVRIFPKGYKEDISSKSVGEDPDFMKLDGSDNETALSIWLVCPNNAILPRTIPQLYDLLLEDAKKSLKEETFLDRLIVERDELCQKIYKLSDALNMGNIPEKAVDINTKQLHTMKSYHKVLDEKIVMIMEDQGIIVN